MESFNHWNSNVVMVATLRLTTSALIVINETRGAAGSRGWSPWLSFSFLKTVTVPVTIYDSFLPCPFYSTLVPMFTVLNSLLEFTYHLLFSWRKFALCIQSLLCMLFLFGWPPYQRSDMILMEVSQHAYDMIHYISGLFGYFCVCEIYVNLIWYLYLFMLNKFCLSLSLSLITSIVTTYWQSVVNVHDDVIKWKHFPRNWPYVRGIHRSRWIPHTKAIDAEFWCFLWSASE